MLSDVSPTRGYESSARAGVTAQPVLFSLRPVRNLFSQYCGPRILNLAETPEEKAAREQKEKEEAEQAELDAIKDEKQKSNFKKVKERAEREEAARKAAEEELNTLRKEKAEREALEKKKKDDEMAAKGQEKELREQKEKELAEEIAKREAAEGKAKEYEALQQTEIDALLKEIPADKQPPLDDSMPLTYKLKLLRYAHTQITGTKGSVGFGNQSEKQTRLDRLAELKKKPKRTEEETNELARLSSEAPVPESKPRNTLS